MSRLLLVAIGFAALWLLACLFGEVCDLAVYWWQKRERRALVREDTSPN